MEDKKITSIDIYMSDVTENVSAKEIVQAYDYNNLMWELDFKYPNLVENWFVDDLRLKLDDMKDWEHEESKIADEFKIVLDDFIEKYYEFKRARKRHYEEINGEK